MIIVGDCGGQYKTVLSLYDKLSLEHPNDQWLFVGDVIDRGPDSARLVRWIRQNDHLCLYGNHEDMMVDEILPSKRRRYEEGIWEMNGGGATLASYEETYPDSYLKMMHEDALWMKHRPRFFCFDGAVVSHAPLLVHDEERLGRHFDKNFIDSLWNRHVPAVMVDRFQVFGHNGKFKQWDHAMCVDDSHHGNICAVHWPSKKVYFERVMNEL